MSWQHGEKELEKFLEFLNCYHPTIRVIANYSREEINFLDVSVRKKNNQRVIDLYIKPTDTHQYLHISSCHVYHSKKSIPSIKALRLNRICAENSFYDKYCNELEIWLRERGYSDKLVRQQILKARKRKRKDLLNDMKDKRNDYKLMLNITHHPNFSNLKDTCNFYTCYLHQTRNIKTHFIRFPLLLSEERKV